MKLLAFLTSLAISISVWSAPVTAEGEYVANPPNWQPIIGYKHPTQKAFYDKANQMRNGNLSGGAILIYDSTPSIIIYHGVPIKYSSLVRHIVVDCDSGLMIPVYDLFYEKQMPNEKDEPIQGIEYEPGGPGKSMLNKSSLIYLTLCPTQT
jgi:hypothetical protein